MFRCETCTHISTPKGKCCYTMQRILKEQVRNKDLPFIPSVVNPIMDKFSEICKRYKDKQEQRN